MSEHLRTHPPADRDDTVEELHGTRVLDPYRYLENPDAERTTAFVAAQNALSEPYLESLSSRPAFLALTTDLLTAAQAGTPWERGGRYFRLVNPGDLDQDQLVTANSIEELLTAPRVLLDPNALSADGTTALTAARVSPDGALLAYGLSEAGSDWRTVAVREIATGADLPDRLTWTKWVSPTWLPDGSGFLYWRYPAPDASAAASATGSVGSEALTGAMGAGELALHRLGESPDADTVVWTPPERDWMVDPWVSPDGTWLVLTASPGTDSRSTVAVRRIDGNGMFGPEVTVVEELADAHSVVHAQDTADGPVLYLRTERDAPRGRLVAVDLDDPAAPWREVIGQHEQDVLVDASAADGAFVVTWSRDAAHRVELRSRAGGPIADVSGVVSEGPVSVTAVHTRADSTEVFLGVTSFTRQGRAFRLDVRDAGAVTELPEPAGRRAPRLPTTRSERVHARSADGTAVPMTVLRRADLPDRPAPALLYGYGGFDVPVLPSFSALFAAWVSAGGVLAVANLRGGGEFGAPWHEAGMKLHKQHVFDDVIGCAEQLIASGVTTAGQLAVHGRSNGGLLVGAAITQRPELFGAALPAVGVLDMFRFHRFTIGWAWTAEYGDPEDAEMFPTLLAYSPLHRLRPGTRYPPTLISTGDHDDRVVPAHSLKFGAEMQRCQAGPGPVLLRIDTRAGHGVGKPARARAAEYADQLAFAAEHTGLRPDAPG